METYGKLLNIAVPVFLALFALEWIIDWRRGHKVIRNMDSISSLSSGMTNVVKDILGISVSILTYSWLVEKVAIIRIENTVMVYIIGFLVIDFQGYWVHRWSHEINFLWNRHIIHHSSEEFNLACALRQSISGFINFFTFLLLPAALLGVPTMVIAIIGPLHLFLQYWYHTRLIGKMGFLEKIIVTPSHHRVHHALNPQYLDKNYGQIFIFWDRWFGTFQEELKEVPPVYGITRPVRTWNPVKINFQHLWLLIRDAWRARRWKDKFRIWFMPTGWRPDDVKDHYPVFSIKDPYQFEKYDTEASFALIVWSWIQMLFNYFLLIYFFSYIARIGAPGIFIYGAFVFISIYAYTELMDRNKNAAFMEMVKSIFGFYLIYVYGDWFGASERVPWYTYVVVAHLVVSVIASSYFAFFEFRKADSESSVGYQLKQSQ